MYEQQIDQTAQTGKHLINARTRIGARGNHLQGNLWM
jgi:hypothetical protein